MDKEPSIWQTLETEIQRFRRDSRSTPILPEISPAELRKELEDRYTFEGPISLEELTEDVIRLLRDYSLHSTHPRYFGLFNPSIRYASIVADTLVALYNPQLAVWSHAPAANEIERHTLRCFVDLLGWKPDSTSMNFTTGGMESNLSAVLAAIAHHFPDSGKQGLGALSSRPAIYITAESHHSFVKIVRMTGLGTDCLREVPTTKEYIMDGEALLRQVERDRSQGWYPLMVVGTAGSTSAGLVDPLPQIATIAEESGLWFHVDAAWGGTALLSPKLAPLLAGIERADSVTWDAHKWLSVPMGTGMFFCRHQMAVANAFAVTASYMPEETGEETVDQYATTVQWSRRMIGLKVFMALAEAGIEGYAGMIEGQARLGDYLRDRLVETGWVIVNSTPLPVVCFTHPDILSGKMTTDQIVRAIHERKRVWISDVVLGEREPALRACITSFNSDESDVDCLIEELKQAHHQLVGA